MLAAYGSEAGVAALKFIPSGGLYIAGGIAPKNKERCAPQSFCAITQEPLHDNTCGAANQNTWQGG